jgi:acetylornithine deacetylase/succinyl-diaminopimelate desuccinylase-like protein
MYNNLRILTIKILIIERIKMQLSEKKWKNVKEEATQLLREYIRVNTTNPPGNEIEGAKFLKQILEKEGFDCNIFESEKNRGNIITRFKGTGENPSLLLISHIDVVPADEDKWKYHPFSGELVDNMIWGRGALDCKSLGIAELMVMLLLKRERIKLKGDVVLAATADEEAGGKYGAGWMVKEKFPLIKTDYVINEGGGDGVLTDKGYIFICQIAEKGIYWMRLKFKGRPGHGSRPHEDNCIAKMAKAINMISSYSSPIKVNDVVEKFVEGFGIDKKVFDQNLSNQILKSIEDKNMAYLINAMMRNTFSPNVVKGGKKTNVIPSECYLEIDSRVLPGYKPEYALEELRKILKDIVDFEVEIIQKSIASQSSLETPLYKIIEKNIKDFSSKAKLIPFMQVGGTDSRFFREKGIPSYGFGPLLIDGPYGEYLAMIHGHNEKISTDNLLFMIKMLWNIVTEFSS